MKAKDIFTPGKFPTFTFVDDHLKEKANYLRGALETGGLVISLSGPSKSGKTVFVEKELGKDNLIHITGAGIDCPDKLWNRVFDIVGITIPSDSIVSKAFTGTLSGKVSGEAGFFAKGGAEVGAEGRWNTAEAATSTAASDLLQLAINELAGSGFFLFIDDFHYISDFAKPEIANHIKECIRRGMNVIVASVPYHSDDVIRNNADLRGRMLRLDFDYWEGEFLFKIAQSGFSELLLDLDADLVSMLVSEAAGSPQLMQALCLNLCYEIGCYEKLKEVQPQHNDLDFFERVCRRTALMTDFSTTVELMRDGPKTRGTVRHVHATHENVSLDVYPLILRAIAEDPPTLTFRYAALTERIQKLCVGEGPAGSSITGACFQMARIASESENAVVLEWDAEHDVLDIRDPYLLFYLRWN